MKMLLAGDHPTLATLRRQYETGRKSDFEFSGVGLFVEFEFTSDAPRVGHSSFELGDVEATVEGLHHGVGAVLFIRDGVIDLLECYTYDEPWPEAISTYVLRYHEIPRGCFTKLTHLA